jgi:hypothetical protein
MQKTWQAECKGVSRSSFLLRKSINTARDIKAAWIFIHLIIIRYGGEEFSVAKSQTETHNYNLSPDSLSILILLKTNGSVIKKLFQDLNN